MQPKTKFLTLPSGATCTVHAPSRFTDMAAGVPPQALLKFTISQITEGIPADPEKGTGGMPARALTQLEIDYLVKSEKVRLIECVGSLTIDGKTVTLVDKKFDQVKPGELTIHDLSQADAELLSSEIVALREEASAKADTFQSASQSPDAGTADLRPVGEALQPVAERHGETAGG